MTVNEAIALPTFLEQFHALREICVKDVSQVLLPETQAWIRTNSKAILDLHLPGDPITDKWSNPEAVAKRAAWKAK